MNFQPPKEISGSGVVAEWQQMAPVWPFQKNNEKSGPNWTDLVATMLLSASTFNKSYKGTLQTGMWLQRKIKYFTGYRQYVKGS